MNGWRPALRRVAWAWAFSLTEVACVPTAQRRRRGLTRAESRMAQTDVLAIPSLTAISGERTHHGFESLRPIGPSATRTFSHIEQRPIVPALGAEISGIDLRQPGLEAQGELREALADRKVLVFRDQDLSPHQYAAFLRVFGTPVKEDMVVDRNHPPEVGAIHTRSNEQQQINFWHMDHSFRELPTRVLSLQ